MKQTANALTIAAAMMFAATFAFSQSDSSTDATTTEDGLSLGTPEPEGPALGQTYVGERFGDWAHRCVKTDAETDPCQMFQLLFDEDGNSVAEIAVTGLNDAGQVVAGANLMVPLETMLTEQVTIRVDNGQGRRYPYAVCTQIGCLARIGLTAADIEAYKAGAGATVRIVPFVAPDQEVVLPMSLRGFTAAYDGLDTE